MVCATNVLTGRRRVFTNEDISVDAVLASACLPELFPAVEIDGEHYWDGGWTGNPAMVGILRKLPKCDLIIVHVDPVLRTSVPRTPGEIHDRMKELGFNTTFWMELSSIGLILKLKDEGSLDRERFGRVHFHAIEASAEFEKIPRSTKLNTALAFLHFLFDLGRKTADGWLARHGEAIGQKSTVDLQGLLPAGL
jgi:NTE family protein